MTPNQLLQEWARERTQDDELGTLASELYSDYCTWCHHHGQQPLTAPAFYRWRPGPRSTARRTGKYVPVRLRCPTDVYTATVPSRQPEFERRVRHEKVQQRHRKAQGAVVLAERKLQAARAHLAAVEKELNQIGYD